MHHEQSITKLGGLRHRMGQHQRRQLVARDDLLAQANDLIRTPGVERRRVLVEQQQFRLAPRRHEQRQRLPLTARERANRVFQAVFETHVQAAHRIADVTNHRFG
jgi:hypothetical protein